MKNEEYKPEEGIVVFLREHAAFMLKIFLFLVGFAILMAFEYHMVMRRAQARLASEPHPLAQPLPPAQVRTAAQVESPPPPPPQNSMVPYLIKDAFLRIRAHDLDGALDKVNLAIQAAPQIPLGYELRGDIYTAKKNLDEATKNYQIVHQMDPKNVHVQFNLAEILFVQKKYDMARPGFAALEHQVEMGDISTYKVFLCDLFSGHEALAAKELDAINQVGANASYYFANAAWCLYHHKIDEARTWLVSAVSIYSSEKVRIYSQSLHDLGYLPLPPLTHL